MAQPIYPSDLTDQEWALLETVCIVNSATLGDWSAVKRRIAPAQVGKRTVIASCGNPGSQ